MNYLSSPYNPEELSRLTVTDSALVAGLRSHVRRDGLHNAPERLRRDDCIALLLGEKLPEPRASIGANGDPAAALADALRAAMAAQRPPLDEDEVRELAHDEATKALNNGAFPVDRVKNIVSEMLAEVKPAKSVLEVSIAGAVNVVEGLRHFQFNQVLTWLAAGVPLWLWGGAGAGKTTMARQLAAGLGVLPYVVSIDPTATMGKLIGFRNLVTGEFVEGLLYKPYKEGGLVCLDEIDTGDASILAGLNSLLANDRFLFPNGETVAKHPAFYVMAGANTKGCGAVGWFSARVKLDGATLDRFACVELKYDEGLEMALCCGIPSTAKDWQKAEHKEERCAAWVSWVQSVRARIGNSLLVSPRASMNGCKALRAGIPVGEVAEALVFKLAPPETRAAIISHCGNPEGL